MSRHLSSLLSRALVAFTIEADNEFEHRTPHFTTIHGGSRSGLWLSSMAMWWNCLRYVGAEGITARKLAALARTNTNVHGMARWGYLAVEDASRPRLQWVLRATAKGRKADEVWCVVLPQIEQRWDERFGAGTMRDLRAALETLASRLDPHLPDCMPIVGYGLKTSGPPPGASAEPASPALPALIARILVAFALEFEQSSDVSIAICSNVLRLAADPVRIRDLPRLAGISKEAVAIAAGFLEKRGYASVKAESAAGRAKTLMLTPLGGVARKTYERLTAEIEERWRGRFGASVITNLTKSLAKIEPSLLGGLQPYPDGWRASLPPIEILPDYPMVSHRGGYPDGS